MNTTAKTMSSVQGGDAALLAARILLAAIFIVSGLFKIPAFAGVQGYMASVGVPGLLLPAVIALEVIGGALIVVGYQTRLAALALAGFTLVAGLLFHFNLADQNQFNHLMKNVAIAGGFLALFAVGPGAWSLDARKA